MDDNILLHFIEACMTNMVIVIMPWSSTSLYSTSLYSKYSKDLPSDHTRVQRCTQVHARHTHAHTELKSCLFMCSVSNMSCSDIHIEGFFVSQQFLFSSSFKGNYDRLSLHRIFTQQDQRSGSEAVCMTDA